MMMVAEEDTRVEEAGGKSQSVVQRVIKKDFRRGDSNPGSLRERQM